MRCLLVAWKTWHVSTGLDWICAPLKPGITLLNLCLALLLTGTWQRPIQEEQARAHRRGGWNAQDVPLPVRRLQPGLRSDQQLSGDPFKLDISA